MRTNPTTKWPLLTTCTSSFARGVNGSRSIHLIGSSSYFACFGILFRPAPRSAHQMVYYKRMLYLFGGEFTSPRQDRFKHFKDLWRFDLETNLWEELTIKKGPSARSGHRAVIYKTKMIVFGGFNDSGEDTVYVGCS